MGRGYGTIAADSTGRLISTHRAAGILTYGPIPDGLHVLHTCDNPPCCNPAHLFLGTPQMNTDDMISKGRASWLKTPQIKEVVHSHTQDAAYDATDDQTP